jgi:hypothetical protein
VLTTIFEAIEPLVDDALSKLCDLVVVPQVRLLCNFFAERLGNLFVLLAHLLLLVAEVVNAVGDMLQYTFELLEAAVDVLFKFLNAALLFSVR